MASEKLDTRLSVLEQKYIDLLERRVQELETKLAYGEGTKHKPLTATLDLTKESKTLDKKEGDDNDTQTKDEKEKEKEREPERGNRYRVVISEFDPRVGDYVDRTNDGAVKGTKKVAESKRAFTFRKNRRRQTIGVIEARTSEGSEVDIESLQLQELLAKVMEKLDEGKGKVTDMSSPFQDLIWCWKEAEEAAATSDELEEAIDANFKDVDAEQQAKLDLRALLDIISTSSGDEALDAYFKNRDAMEKSRTISFSSLWTLFPRGSFIISRPFMNYSQVFVVQSCNIRDINDSDPKLQVIAFSYDWNGTTFNRVLYELIIDEFKDKKTVSELLFYPLKDYREGGRGNNSNRTGKTKDSPDDGTNDVDRLKSHLIERGRKFFKYCTADKGKQTFSYDGQALHTSSGGIFRSSSALDISDIDTTSTMGSSTYATESGTVGTSSYVRGTVVVDFKSYFEYQPDSAQRLGSIDCYRGSLACSCSECRTRFGKLYRYSWDKADKNRPLSDDQYMMFPPRVLGYALDQKRWLDSSNFKNKLILDQNNKDLIENSVKAHGKENVVDYTPGKGKGLILLFWGVPGAGKTLTAESVALLAGKPLFSIGVSDIGTESSKVEANLQRLFALAGLWEAVLLFDEADVCLEGRSSRGSDIRRSTMVTVLLRILEYYEGILILTTNRVKTIDIAVQSRIHIAIEYKELRDDDKERMFLDFLGQLREKGHIENWESCKDWVQEEGRIKSFNGRQIRNTVYTAMGLAHAGGRNLQKKDLVQVARNTELFKKVLSEQEAIYKNSQISRQYGD